MDEAESWIEKTIETDKANTSFFFLARMYQPINRGNVSEPRARI